ncbi:MAG TPA: FAD-binding protein [Opitutaceae bacterium]|nr:FAD-binding protein [Opitutaceae bacterium]
MSSPAQAALRPRTVEEAVEAVRSQARVLAAGAGSKPVPAAPPEGFAALDVRGLSGIIEYDPAEYTFTALAGTPLATVAAELARHGQHLPFDPPFGEAGATLGGTIATGVSGPGRQRYGGVRDFILGVRFISGAGELVRGGGKVVKNAAGFDLPKLFVGSLGRLGVVVEASFKVFPRPRSYATLRAESGSLNAALAAAARLGASPFDFEAVDFDADGTLWLRLGGEAETFSGRLEQLGKFLGAPGERMEGEQDRLFWARRVPPPGGPAELLAKVPVTLESIPALDALLAAAGARRAYGAGGNVAWIRWPAPADQLDLLLRSRGLSGLVLSGPAGRPLLGAVRGEGFRRRLKAALDPAGRFPSY